MTDGNNSSSVGTPGYWRLANHLPDGVIVDLKERLQLRSQDDIVLHVKYVNKGVTRIERDNREYNLAGFDHLKSEILAELRTKVS